MPLVVHAGVKALSNCAIPTKLVKGFFSRALVETVTGEIGENNKVYEGNIVLSPEWVKRLYSQLYADMQSRG